MAIISGVQRNEIEEAVSVKYGELYEIQSITFSRAGNDVVVFLSVTPAQICHFVGHELKCNASPASWNADGSVAEYDVFVYEPLSAWLS